MEIDDNIIRDLESESAEFEIKTASVGLYHRGWRFWPPYACGRCGERISARQFASSRSCGPCDVGHSRAKFSPMDGRWFILGRVQLEDEKDRMFIRPTFLSAEIREEFRPIYRPPPVLHPRRRVLPQDKKRRYCHGCGHYLSENALHCCPGRR